MPPRKSRKKQVAPPAAAPKRKYQRYGRVKKEAGGFLGEFKRNFSLLPQNLTKVLPVTSNIQLYTSTTTPYKSCGVEYVFCLNDIFRPLHFPVGQTGARVLGYDQISIHYRQYCVYAAKVKLTIYDPSTDGMVVACAFQPATSVNTLQGGTITSLQPKPLTYCFVLNDSGNQKYVKEFYLPLHKIEGVSKMAFNINNSTYTADMGASPLESPYLRLAAYSTEGVALANVKVMVDIQMYTRLMDRNPDSVTTYTV